MRRIAVTWSRLPKSSRPARHRRSCTAHAGIAGAAAVGAHRRRSLRQVRESAGHQFVQGARRLRQARGADRAERAPRRDRHVGRQSRPGGGLSRAAAWHIPATIVMPVTTPFVKVKATEALGAAVVLCGETLAEAQARAEAIAAERDLVWVHPFDDSADHRRPRHRRARNARRGARSRRAGRFRSAAAASSPAAPSPRAPSSRRSRSSASNASFIRRCGMRSTAPTNPAAGRRSPKASR